MRSARLGQHFLTDDRTLGRLVEQVPSSVKRLLEIGVGGGRLTERLLESGFEVTGYELDSDLYAKTSERLGGNSRLKLFFGDGFSDNGSYDALVSSLPYYASRKFIEWFAGTPTPLAVVVLQKDFVDKIGSKPGDRKYGAYSVLASYCFQMRELFVIPPQAFEPRPKVFSAVLRLERIRTLRKAESSAHRLKSLFGYRGRLAASFVRDLRKKHLWNNSVDLDVELLAKRVEDLPPQEALDVIRGMAPN